MFLWNTTLHEKMFNSSTHSFDKLLDKATSHLLTEPDWPTIIQLCDLIREGDVSPAYVLHATKKKLMFLQNHHTALYALLVIETIVKNCGYQFREEVAFREFCGTLDELSKTSPYENVRQKAFEFKQLWKIVFHRSPKPGAPKYTIYTSAFDAMSSADKSPESVDGDVCHCCRTIFGKLQDKFHCRACEQVFCSKCTEKTIPLPKIDIKKEVSVCNACYDQVTKQNTEINKAPSTTVHQTLPASLPSTSDKC